MRRSTAFMLSCFLALGMSGGIGAFAAKAQSTTYKIVVPFAPGGGQDVLARLIAPELGKLLGNTFIVENRAGAGFQKSPHRCWPENCCRARR